MVAWMLVYVPDTADADTAACEPYTSWTLTVMLGPTVASRPFSTSIRWIWGTVHGPAELISMVVPSGLTHEVAARAVPAGSAAVMTATPRPSAAIAPRRCRRATGAVMEPR